jgi:hypothetical protein
MDAEEGGGLTFEVEPGAGGERASKRPKLLGEDLVWKPAGENVNLVEVDGKSCTHEVRLAAGREQKGREEGAGTCYVQLRECPHVRKVCR